jgi:hypothetical protein
LNLLPEILELLVIVTIPTTSHSTTSLGVYGNPQKSNGAGRSGRNWVRTSSLLGLLLCVVNPHRNEWPAMALMPISAKWDEITGRRTLN